MRTFLTAAILAGVLATGAHAATYDEKLATCLACHGEKGISETSEVPSLAGMPADFTLIQLFLFRQGTRKIEIMNDVAKDLTDDDLRKLGDYFAKLPPPQAGGDAPDPAIAERAQGGGRQAPLRLLPQPEFLRPRADAAPRRAARGLPAEGAARLQEQAAPGL